MPVIELIFTCYLYANDVLKPAKEFEVLSVRGGVETRGDVMFLYPNWVEQKRVAPSFVEVVMKRKASPGEKIEPPKGCSVEVQK